MPGHHLAVAPTDSEFAFSNRAHALDQMTPPYRIQRKRRIREQTRIPTLFSKGVSTSGLYGGSLTLTLNKQIGAIRRETNDTCPSSSRQGGATRNTK